jgi:2-oxo-4-hydroxy-4-carboxy--5-ureidoimidazoline (OHCU) decarboxylase
MASNAIRPREWPTKARGVAEDVMALQVTLRERMRAAQLALVNGNPNLAMVFMADARELSLRSTEKMGAALRGEYEQL